MANLCQSTMRNRLLNCWRQLGAKSALALLVVPPLAVACGLLLRDPVQPDAGT